MQTNVDQASTSGSNPPSTSGANPPSTSGANPPSTSGANPPSNAGENVRDPPTKRRKIIKTFVCHICDAQFHKISELRSHLRAHQEEEASVLSTEDDDPFMEQALEKALKVVTMKPEGQQKIDMLQLFSDKKEKVMRLLNEETEIKGGLKWHMVCAIRFVKYDKEGEKHTANGFFKSRCAIKLLGEDNATLEHSIHTAYAKMFASCQEYQREGSGWAIEEVLYLRLMMGKYRPLRGSQYIPLPTEIAKSRSIINIQNQDEKCFLWSILAHLHKFDDNPHRVQKYKQYENEINMTDIPYPVKVKDVPKFEKQNDISVNVFGYESNYYPLYISKNQRDIHVNLLLIERNGKTHYCLIKDLNKMLYCQTKHKGKKYFCTYCLHGFTREDLLAQHQPCCQEHGTQCTEFLPEKNKFLEFNNWGKMLKVPFVIYADFECILVPTDEKGKKRIHKPCGYSFLVVSDWEENEIVTYSGENVVENFLDRMMIISQSLADKMKTNIPMVFTEDDEKEYKLTSTCHICKRHMKPNDKVRDHCHFTGRYRGAAHFKCNLAFKHSNMIPVFFHNLEGYDSHLIMQHLGKYKQHRVSCIPKNMEKYISFSLGNLKFLDSLNFMNEGLSTLVNNLAADGDAHFHHIKRHFPNVDQRKLLLRKGVYPYEWMDSLEKMRNTSLPEKDAFYSALLLQGITDEDYSHAQNVWKTFKMETMQDYHDLYLKSDVLLLADCFENFRKKCMEFYDLDPAHYYTTPGFSWDSAMKMTNVSLELLSDIDMHLMVEKGVRGGVSTIITRYCKANNKEAIGVYDETKDTSWIMDLDANNLYGWAMSQHLPTDGFRWMNENEIQDLIVTLQYLSADDPLGYILEVDLEISDDLHDYFNDYVPAPEHMEVVEEMLSPFNKHCLEKLNLKHTKCSKLIPNLHNKTKYVIHYRTLQCYVQLGVKLTKVHRVIEFNQSPWLKEYIDFNTQQRKLAKNDFEKNFFKLMNNSVFGKTIENLRNRTSVELVHTADRFTKIMNKPCVDSFQRFSEDLVAVKMLQTKLILNRPIYAGMVILDLAKLLMYNFYYNVLKRQYGSRLNLLFTDTDSLCVSVKTQDVYKDMLAMHDEYDCSDYPTDHFLHSVKNKKALGKFKDEMGGQVVQEFVGLRSKMYSIIWPGGNAKTCKGIPISVNKHVLKHDMYKECLMNVELRKDKMVRIGSEDHQVCTFDNCKTSLSPFDDKRYVLSDKIHTLAYGHYKIAKI